MVRVYTKQKCLDPVPDSLYLDRKHLDSLPSLPPAPSLFRIVRLEIIQPLFSSAWAKSVVLICLKLSGGLGLCTPK
jgi:hypothetical protein